MSARDDFTKQTVERLRLRAGTLCSICNRPTTGPSGESSSAVNNIGRAAHITAAAPGGKRYDASLTPEQRRDIENGIWCCANHAAEIDNDEVRYTVAILRQIKADHDAKMDARMRDGDPIGADGDALIQIGSNIVFLGALVRITTNEWQFQIGSFVTGEINDLIRYISEFGKAPPAERFVLNDKAGDGRALAEAPQLEMRGAQTFLVCSVWPRAARQRVQDLPLTLASSAKNNDIFLDKNNNIARIRGLESFPQRLRENLNLQLGESPFHPDYGTRIAEYFQDFKGSPWFERLLKLEIIRQTAIAMPDTTGKLEYPSMPCVDAVRKVAVLSEPVGRNLPVRLSLDVHGLGDWQGDLNVIITRALRRWHASMFDGRRPSAEDEAAMTRR